MDFVDPKEREKLIKQLHTFETTLVKGIGKRANIPVKIPKDSEVTMNYRDGSELRSIEYNYPLKDGAYLNIYGTIFYTERSELTIGIGEFNSKTLELVPEITLQIEGYNEKRKLFWSQTTSYESPKAFKFGDKYILGVPTEHMEDAQIFLVPMAEGVVRNLKIKR